MKLVSEFYARKESKDGLFKSCKECQKKYAVAWNSANLERVKELGRRWRESNPDRVRAMWRRRDRKRRSLKPAWVPPPKRARPILLPWEFKRDQKAALWFSEFGAMFLHLYGYKVSEARREMLVRRKKVRREYERLKEFRRRGAQGKFTKADISRLFYLQAGKCAGCRTGIEGGYDVDHIMPIALGGSNWPENLQLLCGPCNNRKGALHPEVWKSSLEFRPAG